MSRLKRGLNALKLLFKSYHVAWKRGELRPLFLYHLRELIEGIEKAKLSPLGPLDVSQLAEIKAVTFSLHLDLQKESPLFFSALMPVFRPNPLFLKKALLSVLEQTAPNFEVLVGFDGPQPLEVIQTVEELKISYGETLKTFSYEWGGISSTTNRLAKEARGSHLLLVDHDDWMAPDLLYHYHKKLADDSERVFLYCDEFKIDRNDQVIPHTLFQKDSSPPFPYLLFNLVTHALCLSSLLWKEVGGLRSEMDGAQDFDLVLRLDLLGAKGINIPHPLYGWRVHPESTSFGSSQKPKADQLGLLTLQSYQAKKGLNWRYESGVVPLTYRAIPPLSTQPKIQVMGRNAFASQKGVEICQEGGELLFFGNSIFFKDEHALEEMARFAMQKEIGIVFCRLENGVGATYAPPFFFEVQRVVRGYFPPAFLIRRELLSEEEIKELAHPHRLGHSAILKKLEDEKLPFYTPFARGILLTES